MLLFSITNTNKERNKVMAISEKNKEIITQQLAKHINNIVDTWQDLGHKVWHIAKESNLHQMHRLVRRHSVECNYPKIKYDEDTAICMVVDGMYLYKGECYLSVRHNHIINWQRIGMSCSNGITQIFRILPRMIFDHVKDGSAEEIACDIVDSMVDSSADKFIKLFNDVGDDFIKHLCDNVCDAMNKYISILTDAYNIALERERENDAKILSAFGLDDGGIVKVEPKQFKITIEEVKGE